MSMPSKASGVASSTVMSRPATVMVVPAERADARSRSSVYGNCFSVRTWIMVRPTAPVAPTTATVSFSGLVSGTVRPSGYGLSGTAGVYQRASAPWHGPASSTLFSGGGQPPRDPPTARSRRRPARRAPGNAPGARSRRSGAEAGPSGSSTMEGSRATASSGTRATRAGGRHRLDRGVVLGAEDELGSCPCHRISSLQRPRAAARAEADQTLGADLRPARGFDGRRGAREPAAVTSTQGVPHQLHDLERSRRERQRSRTRGPVAELDQVHQTLVRRLR